MKESEVRRMDPINEMKVKVECAQCKKLMEVEINSMVGQIISCSEREVIYGGFVCDECTCILKHNPNLLN